MGFWHIDLLVLLPRPVMEFPAPITGINHGETFIFRDTYSMLLGN